jgi:hypothetical protein
MRDSPIPVLVLSLCAFACRQVEPRDASAPTVLGRPTRAWTEAFMKEAVLTADAISIEGPSDLLDHVAIRQDPEAIQYETRTVPEGLLQELVARPELGVEIQVQLDAWTLAAFRRVTILQRPGEVPVTIRAQGSALWARVDGSGERRDDALEFHGVHGN